MTDDRSQRIASYLAIIRMTPAATTVANPTVAVPPAPEFDGTPRPSQPLPHHFAAPISGPDGHTPAPAEDPDDPFGFGAMVGAPVDPPLTEEENERLRAAYLRSRGAAAYQADRERVLKASKEGKAALRAAGKCETCALPRVNAFYCQEHADKKNAAKRARRAKKAGGS